MVILLVKENIFFLLNLTFMRNPSLRQFVNIATKRMNKAIYKQVFTVMKQVMTMWWLFFVEEFHSPKHGREYYLPTRAQARPLGNWGRASGKQRGLRGGRVYTASAEGEYPASVTGNFLEQLKFNISSYNPEGAVLRITITSGAYYTHFLIENGRSLIEESKEDFWEIMKPEIMKLKNKKIRI